VTTAKFSGAAAEVTEVDQAWDDDSVELLTDKSENQLVAKGVVLLQRYQRNRTETLRELARVVVSLRMKYKYKDLTDWGGNNGEYRKKITEMYQRAGLDKDSESSMQKALRYHVGVIVRKTAPVKELETLGIIPKTQSQRQLEKGATTTDTSDKTMKGQGAVKDEKKDKKVFDGEPVPTTGGDNVLAHLRICMFHLEQASSKKVTKDNATEVLDKLQQITKVALDWAGKVDAYRASIIKDSAEKASKAS
jgi:hypothetical protein